MLEKYVDYSEGERIQKRRHTGEHEKRGARAYAKGPSGESRLVQGSRVGAWVDNDWSERRFGQAKEFKVSDDF